MRVRESDTAPADDLPFIIVTFRGTSLTEIPIRITPLTYSQFQTDFSTLDQLYPARPVTAASGNTGCQ